MALAQGLMQTRFVVSQICIFPFCFKEEKSNYSCYCHEAASLKHRRVETSMSLTMLIQACWTCGPFLQSKAYETHCNTLHRKIPAKINGSFLYIRFIGLVSSSSSSSLKTLTDGLLFFTCFSSSPVWDHSGSWMMAWCVRDWERLRLGSLSAEPGWAPVAAQGGGCTCAWAQPEQHVAPPSPPCPDLLLHGQLLVETHASQTQTAVLRFQSKTGSDFSFSFR